MLISNEKCSLLESSIVSGRQTFCSGLFLSARWFVLSQVCKKGLHIIVLPGSESAEYCCADLYNLIEGDNVFFLPQSGKGVDKNSYVSSLNVQRTTALKLISEKISGCKFIVTYPEALKEGIPALKDIKKNSFSLKAEQEIKYEDLIHTLGEMNFERVDFVSAPGQFAIRGSIIDIFSYSDNYPYRIFFWGDEIEKINSFDCNTQLSKDNFKEVEIVSQTVSETGECSIFDIIPSDTVFWLDSSDMYKDMDFSKFKRVYIDKPLSKKDEKSIEFYITPQPVFNKNFELLVADIRNKIETGYKIFVYGDKESQLTRIKNILDEQKCPLPEFIAHKPIHNGFIDKEDKICCYTDHEIFDRFHRVSLRKTVEKSEQLTLNDLNAIKIGDYVVHIDHGIGIFSGLVRIPDDKGRMREVVKIKYKDSDVIFVSVHALHKICRYRSSDGIPPKINKLGSKTWLTMKNSAKSKVKDIAKELIQLYAKRRSTPGFAFSADTMLQEELESSFMYDDTPDQETATRAVKSDMEDTCPMDRLICGDVGFGKTEVAIRAAFKAVCDGKQVAVLVPTTILALQHYNTFKSRLADFPCSVDYVSRLRTTKEINEIKKNIACGATDIIIGTHKILGADFEFKDLGLLIIDEEQKFGVSAKEKLRHLKHNVDTLTLSATPIPRTLQFSLLGARDLSIINTPPANRIPVQTEIILFEKEVIRSIIDYELKRGGQVFFLHNKVEELPSIEEILHRLIPDMKICVAHGQMEAKVLEDKMLGFISGDYDLMLCTTIIENGLDIPNANTIIINQAQNIGLSDLHQLRGRVGRSNRKAFCYLIVPPLVSITDDARRRLKAIEEFSDLGSGFNIAMQDLDIRGAGNLLGAQQSGFIMNMGYETYQKIIAEAMEELGIETGVEGKKRKDSFQIDCTIETDQPAMIPDDYLNVTSEKLRIYKQLDSMRSDKEVDRFRSQMEDRFGHIPPQFENLLWVLKLRNLGSSLGFEKIIVKNGLLICFFVANTMNPYYKSKVFGDVLEKINAHPSLFALKQTDKLKIVSRGVDSIQKAFETVKKLS